MVVLQGDVVWPDQLPKVQQPVKTNHKDGKKECSVKQAARGKNRCHLVHNVSASTSDDVLSSAVQWCRLYSPMVSPLQPKLQQCHHHQNHTVSTTLSQDDDDYQDSDQTYNVSLGKGNYSQSGNMVWKGDGHLK